MSVTTTMTERAEEVCRLAASGLQDKAIARRLEIDVTTVKKHIQTGLRATGFKSRVELAGRYLSVPDAAPKPRPIEVVLKTDLERALIKLVARGLQSQAVADEVGVDVRDVRKAEKRLRRRAGVMNRTQLVRWYLRQVGPNG